MTPGESHGGQVTLAWEPSAHSAAVGYELHYGLSPENYSDRVDVGNRLQYTLTGLRPATTYYFGVRAYSADPRLYSEFSNQVSAVVTQVSAPPVVAPEPRSTPRAGPAPGAAAEGAVLPRSFKGQPNRGVLIIDGVRWKAPPPPGP